MKLTFIKTLAVAAIVAGALSGAVHAAGSASLSLTPNSGSHVKGSSFTVQVHENGSDVSVVTAKLSYDASKLNCTGVGASSAFPNTISASCSNGSVTISRYTNPGDPAVSGDQVVGSITFVALAESGSTSVTFAAGSQIASNGSNVWNGNTAGGTYSFTAPASQPSTPSTPSAPANNGSTSTTKNYSSNSNSANKPAANNAVAGDATQTPATSESTPVTAEQAKADATPTTAQTKQDVSNFGRTIAWILAGIGFASLVAGVLYWATQRKNQAAKTATAVAAAPVVAKKAESKKAPAKKPAAKRSAKASKKA